MKRETIIAALIGLAAGLIVGFVTANSLNKTGYEAATSPISERPTDGQAMPANHPAIGTSAGQTTGGALPQVTEAIERAKNEPTNFEAQMTAADLYYQIQRFEEAAKFYEAASKLRPADIEPITKLGNSLFESEKYVEAEKQYLRVLEKEPKNINVRTDLGLTFFLREPPDLDRAIKEYNTTLETDPVNEIALQNLTLAYRNAGDAPNANATMDRLKKVNPANPLFTKSEGSTTVSN